MYNSVWLEDQEVRLHRFLWRDSEEEELGEYAVTKVNIGDKPAGCIAQLASSVILRRNDECCTRTATLTTF